MKGALKKVWTRLLDPKVGCLNTPQMTKGSFTLKPDGKCKEELLEKSGLCTGRKQPPNLMSHTNGCIHRKAYQLLPHNQAEKKTEKVKHSNLLCSMFHCYWPKLTKKQGKDAAYQVYIPVMATRPEMRTKGEL